MSYGQPPEPQGPYPHQQPQGAYPHQQPAQHPQQPWGDPSGYGSPGAPRSPEERKGPLPAVASFVLGVLGCAVPLLPTYGAAMAGLEGARPLLWFPFAIPGFVLAIVGLRGRRRGQLLAVFGAIFSVLGLIGGLVMVVGWYILN